MSNKKMIQIALGLVLAAATSSFSQNKTNNNQSRKMETVQNKTSKEVVQGFFKAFGSGDFNGLVDSFHDSCTVIGIRDGQRIGSQIYGTYKGKEGVKSFIGNLGSNFDTKAFTIDHLVGEGNTAFACGEFTHVVKATGKTFSSAWALMCEVEDEKIIRYHFYEDSEKFAEASRK